MGTRVTKAGLSVQFCDRDGNIEGPSIFSRFVRLFGQPYKEVVQRSGDLSEEERKLRGSDDWLTLVAIADTHERLCALVDESTVPCHEAQTSGSSRRVQIELHVGDVRMTHKGRITIASGPIVSQEPPIMNVRHITVLGEGAVMDEHHPLRKEFVAQTPVR